MLDTRALRPSAGLRAMTTGALAVWMVIAAFPLVWILEMSFKLPVDAFASDPLQVLLGPVTRVADGGLSLFDVAFGLIVLMLIYRTIAGNAAPLAARLAPGGRTATGWAFASVVIVAAVLLFLIVLLPATRHFDHAVVGVPSLDWLARPVIGFTWQHYRAVWVEHAFWRNFVNSMIVTAGVVTISLTVGTLAAFALARS